MSKRIPPFFNQVDIPDSTRREFLKFVGSGAVVASTSSGALSLLSGCASVATRATANKTAHLPFSPLAPTVSDQVELAKGFEWSNLIKFNDVINAKGELFGANNDYLAIQRLNEDGSDLVLWVNHESFHPLFVSGHTRGTEKTRKQVDTERLTVGGSLLRVRKDKDGEYRVVANDPLNRRVGGTASIPIITARPIMGSKTAIGTLANCAGGHTPWGTFLTCEENYDDFYGEAIYDENGQRKLIPSAFGWEKFYPNPPEHYGWVVEVNPLTGSAKKLTALGRFAHESSTVRPVKDGRCVVYSGDDANDRCLYKFIASRPGSLETGKLYVANLEQKRWISLMIEDQPNLKKRFKDQTEVLIRAREAAEIVGGTPLARPEDIEIEPKTGAVFVVLTNNSPKGNYFGSILKIEEKNGDPLALEFESSTFITGGADSGFASPDNIAFDSNGNLWMTTDISGKSIGQKPYEKFGNNSLFYIPLSGEGAGQAFRVANAPMDAEFTGPCFSPDGRTLFLAVQHPGELSKSLDQLTSHWPEGGQSIPKSSIITIRGESLDRLMAGSRVEPIFQAPVLKSNSKK